MWTIFVHAVQARAARSAWVHSARRQGALVTYSHHVTAASARVVMSAASPRAKWSPPITNNLTADCAYRAARGAGQARRRVLWVMTWMCSFPGPALAAASASRPLPRGGHTMTSSTPPRWRLRYLFYELLVSNKIIKWFSEWRGAIEVLLHGNWYKFISSKLNAPIGNFWSTSFLLRQKRCEIFLNNCIVQKFFIRT